MQVQHLIAVCDFDQTTLIYHDKHHDPEQLVQIKNKLTQQSSDHDLQWYQLQICTSKNKSDQSLKIKTQINVKYYHDFDQFQFAVRKRMRLRTQDLIDYLKLKIGHHPNQLKQLLKQLDFKHLHQYDLKNYDPEHLNAVVNKIMHQPHGPEIIQNLNQLVDVHEKTIDEG